MSAQAWSSAFIRVEDRMPRVSQVHSLLLPPGVVVGVT